METCAGGHVDLWKPVKEDMLIYGNPVQEDMQIYGNPVQEDMQIHGNPVQEDMYELGSPGILDLPLELLQHIVKFLSLTGKIPVSML